MTSNMIYIVALGVGFKCPRKIHLNTQCPSLPSRHSIWMAPNRLIMYLLFLFFSSFLFDSCFVYWNSCSSAASWMLPLSNEDWLVCPLGRQKTIWCLSLYESHSDNCVPLLVLFSSQNAQRKDNKETWKVRDLINFINLICV